MLNFLIIDNAYFDCFTTCKPSEVSANIQRAKEFYEEDKSLYESHLVNYPEMTDHWQTQLDRTKKILKAGFRPVTFEEYKQLQREKWLSNEPKEITEKEYYYAMEVLPPKNWIDNERYSMFFIGECTTMTFYGQYLYDKVNGKYYYALADIFDKSTWLNKMLSL